MISIVSSSPPERAAFIALCESRGWPCVACDSLRAFRHALRRARPRAVLVRGRLADGYSDDALTVLAAAGLLPAVKVVVLLASSASSAQQARQLALGADSVQRDPVRTDVLAAYLAKYRARTRAAAPTKTPAGTARHFSFAGAAVHPLDRELRRDGRLVRLTRREVQLAELLFDSRGDVVTYETLFTEILGARFAGNTSNMRVLLGKLDASFRTLGLALRRCLDVIPKTGYRYRPPRARSLRLAPAREGLRPAAA